MSAIDALVSLTGLGLDHLNTLAPFEIRPIVIAQGKQFRNDDHRTAFTMPEVLRLPGSERVKLSPGMEKDFPAMATLPAIPLEDGPGGTFKFFSAAQGVMFTIKVVNTKTDFVSALLTPEVHMVYAGHARYGRGPCFGTGATDPGENWEEGTGAHPNADGIFRMGFPFIGVTVGEIIEHGYTANIARSDVTIKAADSDPDLRSHVGGLKRRSIDDIATAAMTTHEFQTTDELKGLTRDQVLAKLNAQIRDADPAATYWTYRTGAGINVVHIAGWENTLSAPDDLGAQTPLCRVFTHLGCSTFVHNYPVMRKLKKWTRDGNERYAYWTTDVARSFIVCVYWVQNLLTFGEFNANQPLAKSLAHTVRATNANLLQDRQSYRVI